MPLPACPTNTKAIATLVNIASLDRPEEKIKGLPRIVAESIGRDINDVYRGANGGDVRSKSDMHGTLAWHSIACLSPRVSVPAMACGVPASPCPPASLSLFCVFLPAHPTPSTHQHHTPTTPHPNKHQLKDVDLNRKITEAVRAAVRASVESVTNSEGRIEKVDTLFSEGMKFLEGENRKEKKGVGMGTEEGRKTCLFVLRLRGEGGARPRRERRCQRTHPLPPPPAHTHRAHGQDQAHPVARGPGHRRLPRRERG